MLGLVKGVAVIKLALLYLFCIDVHSNKKSVVYLEYEEDFCLCRDWMHTTAT